MPAVVQTKQVNYNKNFLLKWFPVVIVAITVIFLAIFFVAKNIFNDETIIENSGYFLSSDNEIGTLKQDSNSLKNKLTTIPVKSGDTIYHSLLGAYFSADKDNPVSFNTPQFIGDGTTIVNYNPDVNFIDTDLKHSVGRKDVSISYGKIYNLDNFNQIEHTNYLLLRYENNIMLNLYDLKVQISNNIYNIPVNSFVYFADDYINYYARLDDGFYFYRILDIDSDSIVSFNYDANSEKYEYEYGNFLNGIRTVYLQNKT